MMTPSTANTPKWSTVYAETRRKVGWGNWLCSKAPASSPGVRNGWPAITSATRNQSATTAPARIPPVTPWTITACTGRLMIPPPAGRRLRAIWRVRAGPERLSRRALQPGGDALRRAHHPQDIQTRDFLDVELGPAAPQQLRDQVGKLRDVLQPVRHFGDAVEVGADPDVVDPRHLPDMLDVVGDLPQRRVRRRRVPRPHRIGGRRTGSRRAQATDRQAGQDGSPRARPACRTPRARGARYRSTPRPSGGCASG